MQRCRAFTMIEMIVVMIITAILAAIAIPTYLNFLQQGSGTATEHNLIAIYHAQKNYFLNNGAYCTSSSTTPANCGSNLTNLNNYLATLNQANPTITSLGISDSYFTYQCTNPNNDNNQSFTCTATNVSDSNYKLNITNGQIVLPGGSGCTTISGASCNPVCVSDNSNLCPSS